jgi:hypothetical protein
VSAQGYRSAKRRGRSSSIIVPRSTAGEVATTRRVLRGAGGPSFRVLCERMGLRPSDKHRLQEFPQPHCDT